MGNFLIGICGAAAIRKLGALAIQIILTYIKSDFVTYATSLLPLVKKIQNFPSWWIIRNIVNKVCWPTWLLQDLCSQPEGLTEFISCLVGSVLQIVGSKNKAGHKPDWCSPAYFHADWRLGSYHWKKDFDTKSDWFAIEDARRCALRLKISSENVWTS